VSSFDRVRFGTQIDAT